MTTDTPPEGRVRFEREGRVARITIDRPAKYNGFTPEMLDQLAAAYAEYERDASLFAALLQ
ncbi:MAG: enoyl-CoA hydratase, partial [Deltaproteobacteria bacterium]|nr:enoyl-CoA hydratase [Deltaproteobacteria bacterium]